MKFLKFKVWRYTWKDRILNSRRTYTVSRINDSQSDPVTRKVAIFLSGTELFISDKTEPRRYRSMEKNERDSVTTSVELLDGRQTRVIFIARGIVIYDENYLKKYLKEYFQSIVVVIPAKKNLVVE